MVVTCDNDFNIKSLVSWYQKKEFDKIKEIGKIEFMQDFASLSHYLSQYSLAQVRDK